MDSDDEIEVFSKWDGVPGTIILFNALEDSETTSVAHEAICRLIKLYLRSSSSQNVGVSLYGTVKTESAFNTNNVVDILPMDVPTLDAYKKIRDINIESYGKTKVLMLSEVLWHCSKIFKNCKKKLSSQTVIILMRLNKPPIETDREPTLKRVVDLVELYTEIKFINISMNDYVTDPFYNTFLIEANKSKEFVIPKAVWDSKLIEKLMYQHSHQHKAIAKLHFEIGNGLSIGVGVYRLLKISGQSYHKTSNLDRETNEPITSVTKTTKVTISTAKSSDKGFNDDTKKNVLTDVPLLDQELLYCIEYGGEQIEFTKTEKKQLENPFGPRTMKLLGFKPGRIMCKEKWFLKTGYFLFPNENIIEGSTIAFKALHKACTEMDTVAICILCTKVNARPTIVALVPCTNPLDLEIEIGFDVIHIPFIENVRDIPSFENENEKVKDIHKDAMKEILQCLQFNYKADMFENPKLQSEYRAIEAKALNEENVEKFVDTTIASSKKFQDIKDDLFEELFGPFGVLSLKRTANNKSNVKSKKAKSEDIGEEELKNSIASKTVSNYTVPQLKKILKCISNKPALTGLSKDELVDLVYKHCR